MPVSVELNDPRSVCQQLKISPVTVLVLQTRLSRFIKEGSDEWAVKQGNWHAEAHFQSLKELLEIYILPLAAEQHANCYFNGIEMEIDCCCTEFCVTCGMWVKRRRLHNQVHLLKCCISLHFEVPVLLFWKRQRELMYFSYHYIDLIDAAISKLVKSLLPWKW